MLPGRLAALQSLLDGPSPAVLTTYRADGSAHISPVWFRLHEGGFEVVIAEGDLKLRNLAGRTECELLVFESVRPFRGVRVAGVPTLRADDGRVRAAVAARYLGAEDGSRFAQARHTPGVVLRLDAALAKAWDLSAILPG